VTLFDALSRNQARREAEELALMDNYDVLVVGAGPSGSLLSYYLGTAGLNVLLIDKQSLPRYKACGGGITRRAAALIPFDIDSVIEDYSYRVSVSWQGKRLYSNTSPEPIIAMVMRERFDYFLTSRAILSGVQVLDNTNVIGIERGKAGSIVSTSGGKFNAGFVVGADGVNSRVAKALGLQIDSRYNIALAAEVYPEDIGLLDRYKNEVEFDLNVVPEGYGWVFPKKDHLSVGVFSSARMAKYLRPCLDEYLRMKKVKDGYTAKRTKAQLIPIHPNKNNILGTEKGCAIGDAAGFADPITGEGIYYGIREAQIAAEAIIKHGPSGSLQYSDMVKLEFMEETRAAEKMSMFYRFPRTTKYILTRFPKYADYHLQIFCGEQSYFNLYKKVFSVKSVERILSQFIRRLTTA
jgi:geranylgeranyl reductase family protein